MAEENGTARDLLNFQLNSKITFLSKSFLIMLEDAVNDGVELSPERYNRMRKKILDGNGAAIRNLETFLDKLDINFKI